MAVCTGGRNPRVAGDPILIDESLEQIVPESIQAGESSASASTPATPCVAMQVGRMARERGAWVVYGGIHATLFPEEAFERGRRTP